MRAYRLFLLLTVLGSLLLSPAAAFAVTIEIDAARDNTIYMDGIDRSNGAGSYFFAGNNGEGLTRRGLLVFDVAGSIPAGSTINNVTLTLYMSMTQAANENVSLHAALANWGEGSSNAPGGEGSGASAADGDATWKYRFYDVADPTSAPVWTVFGGDFVGAASGTTAVGGNGFYTWSAPGMVSDVQGWLDSPGSDFGWFLRGTEVGFQTAKRFDSRQSSNAGQRPGLTVDYTAAGRNGACCLPLQSCQTSSATECSNLGGIFQGEDVACFPNPCQPDPTGACCADDGSCAETTEAQCDAHGDTYQGDGETCAQTSCPVILEPFVDPLPIPAVAQPVTGRPGGAASYEIVMQEIEQELHRDLPPTTVWGYGDDPSNPTSATYPGPTLEAASGQAVSVDWINDIRDLTTGQLRTSHYLPVAGTDPPGCIHGAQDLAKTVVHLHGAHVQPEFDGYPELTYLPGNQEVYTYPNHQLPATLWYHDHALGITRLNNYMGLSGFYLIRDAFEQALGLPGGEYEIPLVIQDRSFNPDGSLQYPAEWEEHFFGNTILVNGKAWPFLEVKLGKYRFRILNASGSRTYTLSLDRPGLQLQQIGTEGGLMPAPVEVDEITLGPAERADVVIDFEGIAPGTEIDLINTAPAPFPGSPGVGVIRDVIRFVVQSQTGNTAPLPSSLRPIETLQESDAIKTREFVLRKGVDECTGSAWTINGLRWDDIVEYPQLGTTEIWSFINDSGVTHPMHMHLVMFQILDRQAFTQVGEDYVPTGPKFPPDPNEVGWKDTARSNPQMITRVIARFEDYAGKFAYHCHILEHEDQEMMRQFRTVEPLALSLDGSGMTWPGQPGATGYDVIGGDLALLHSSGGDFAVATGQCVSSNQSGTSAPTAGSVPSGQAYWYLVRALNAGGKGTYDTGLPSQLGYRDAEIQTSGADCP